MDINDLLHHNNQTILFPNTPIIAGVTTNVLGNFDSRNSDSEKNIKILKYLTKSTYHGQLRPEHKVKIINLPEEEKNESVAGDAVIYGNRIMGYIILIHCSWKTLGEDIIPLTLAEMDRIGFWNIGATGACIYPGICQTCYEVGEEVASSLMIGNIWKQTRFKYQDDKSWLFDLSGYIYDQLIKLANWEFGIKTIPTCSAHSRYSVANSWLYDSFMFYSHRAREEKTRNAVFAKLPWDDKTIISPTGDCPYAVLYALPNNQ